MKPRMTRRGGRRFLPWSCALLALALAGCAQAPRPATGAGAEATRAGRALERALDEALARQAWNDLRIDTECRTPDGFRSATVYSSGVGTWNGERQFTLPRQEMLSLLKEFQAARFARMPETYGTGEELDADVELTCSVRLELEGTARQVVQLSRGEQSRELERLAERILEAAEAAGRSEPGAASLTAGLAAIARGELAPELLTLHVLRRSEAPGSATGWRLGLEGSKVSLERDPAPAGEKPRTFRLPPAEVAELARQLAAARPEELPVNLWAPEYTDLEIRVLNYKRPLQARQFAGMTPSTHGELQQRFDRLWEILEGLRRRLLAGQRSP
jgi:hypothetical protein